LDQISDTGTIRSREYPAWDLTGDSLLEWALVDHRDSCYVYGFSPVGVAHGTAGESGGGRPTPSLCPNPSSGSLSIVLARAGCGERSIVSIFDVSGRLMRSLAVAQSAPAELGPVVWDGTDGSGGPAAGGLPSACPGGGVS